MKRKILPLLFILPICLAPLVSFSQCDPASQEECPDPENNGQVCPDSLIAAHVGLLYSQVATILPPDTFLYLNNEVALHHVKLMEVGNLPPGITWQSNAPDSIFTAGEYHCVLMEGIADSAGEYPLRITVGVYILFFGTPVLAATVTDSTSLTLVVLDDAGIKDDNNTHLVARQNMPNPFQSSTRIDFHSKITGRVDFEVYSLLGQRVFDQRIDALNGENSLIFNGQMLPEGLYFYIFHSDGYKSTGMMIRKD